MSELKFRTIIIYILIIAAFGGLFYATIKTPNFFAQKESMQESPKKKLFSGRKEPFIVKEKLTLPDTKKVTSVSGATFEIPSTRMQTPILPETPGETVIVPNASLSVKGAYETALKQALKWNNNSKLSFIKSLGAVTADGKSSQWQLVFVSAVASKKAYEIVIQGDKIVSEKEIASEAKGENLPAKFFDSDEAVRRLARMPQFKKITISAINLFYNPDAKAWRYVFATSSGPTSLEI